ncbi:MAG: tyrosine--tRNA ligase [Clostridia bacterium]|nr:tyrosine--tRNA ligase [Clostridia bacterium]
MQEYENVYQELKSRDLIKQIAFEEDFKKLVSNEKISVYLGIDPTADSIHIGHFVPLMLMSYFQKHGHRPIILMGGGTALIGDPSGKTDMRKMLTVEDIQNNVEKIKAQISKFVSFEGDNAAIIVNNADWILSLNYMDFIRTYGIHFNVNHMLQAECFKQRMERGLTFFELNYMLMQSYDYLKLYENYNCKLEIGGDDQWSNMIAGVELIRKLHKEDGFCLTCPLLLKADGKKMGKTEKGALWLDPEKTTPYEFYQYWRNIGDTEVNQVLRMLTYLPMDKVTELSSLEGEQINEAKKVLAFEITKLIHGEDEAIKVQETAESLFGNKDNIENMPQAQIEFADEEMLVIDMLVNAKITASKSEAKTLISQGGISIDDEKLTEPFSKISKNDFSKGYVIVKKGKKVFVKVIIK